jgi:3-methyl-2-oxobutanoate hydroxymethyltransferase
VCAHLGLTPQSVHKLGGYRVQGRGADAEAEMLSDARALEEAGADMVLMEAVPARLAAQITAALDVPTIGIGAGVECSGQVLVLHDMLDVFPGRKAKFVRNFMQDAGQGGAVSIGQAISSYVQAVKDRSFPAEEHSF